MHRLVPVILFFVTLAGMSGCGDDCAAGSTLCDGDLILVCVHDEDYDEDEDSSCGLFCDLIDIWANRNDNYWVEDEDCSLKEKTCLEKTDANGDVQTSCGYNQDY